LLFWRRKIAGVFTNIVQDGVAVERIAANSAA
jgi:hypothetical protein